MAVNSISGVILAGGLGRRMGGVDKGLQILRGRPLVGWVIERLAPQVDELLLNANRNAEHYAGFGLPIHADRVEGFAGPLAGLQRALEVARHPLVLTVPCDSPFLPADLAARLREGLETAGADLAIARAGGRRHPVFCLCRRACLADLNAYLAAGERRFEAWVGRQAAVEVDFADEAAFANINTPDELARCERAV